jgi:hypothetical protein
MVRERDRAYQIQNRYLHQEGSNIGYHMGGYVHNCAVGTDGSESR